MKTVEIHMEQLKELFDIEEAGEESLVEKLVENFQQKLPEYLTKMSEARSTGNHAVLEAVAHSLKSSAALLGGRELAAVCLFLETAGHERQPFHNLDASYNDLVELSSATVGELRKILVARAASKAV